MKDETDVAVEDVEAALTRMEGVLRPTPVVWSEHRGAFLKLENLQVTGAFKVRGAFNAVATQIERGDRRPIVSASAGNHAQGLAWAARHFGLGATVVVPETTPAPKVRGCRRLGADVVRRGESFDASLAHARTLAAEEGMRFLHAFDDPDVIAGQGTAALELLEHRPDVVLVAIGGGSLASGMGTVLKAHGIRVVGVQMEGLTSLERLLQGRNSFPEPPVTIADGLRVKIPGKLTSRICAEVLDDLITIPESEVKRTLIDLLHEDHVVAEGAGATAVAALPRVAGKRKVAMVSGGNIDGELLFQLHREEYR